MAIIVIPVPIEEAIFANIISQNLESLYILYISNTSLSLAILTLIEKTGFAFSHWSKMGLIHLAEYELGTLLRGLELGGTFRAILKDYLSCGWDNLSCGPKGLLCDYRGLSCG